MDTNHLKITGEETKQLWKFLHFNNICLRNVLHDLRKRSYLHISCKLLHKLTVRSASIDMKVWISPLENCACSARLTDRHWIYKWKGWILILTAYQDYSYLQHSYIKLKSLIRHNIICIFLFSTYENQTWAKYLNKQQTIVS